MQDLMLPATPTTFDQTRVHDPVIVREGDTYFLFSTGRGIACYSSLDLQTWTRRDRVLSETEVPAWTTELVPGSTDHLWAPEIVRWNERWHLFYSVSTFGKNTSAIGLATNATLDTTREDYLWRDEGVVVRSVAGDNFNAIDPAFALDEHEKPWLFFGSFWSGIKAVELDSQSVKPHFPDAMPISIARRFKEDHDAVEAPFVVRRGEWCYVFVSFDACCRGMDSTYNIRVGRAKNIIGPYFDRDDRALLEGGGTLLRSATTRWRGPGHCCVFEEEGRDFLVYHAYDALERGVPKLRIEPLDWDDNGWPHLPSTPVDDSELLP